MKRTGVIALTALTLLGACGEVNDEGAGGDTGADADELDAIGDAPAGDELLECQTGGAHCPSPVNPEVLCCPIESSNCSCASFGGIKQNGRCGQICDATPAGYERGPYGCWVATEAISCEWPVDEPDAIEDADVSMSAEELLNCQREGERECPSPTTGVLCCPIISLGCASHLGGSSRLHPSCGADHDAIPGGEFYQDEDGCWVQESLGSCLDPPEGDPGPDVDVGVDVDASCDLDTDDACSP